MHYDPIIDESWSDDDQEAYFAFLENRRRDRRRPYNWSLVFLACSSLVVWSENWVIHHLVASILLVGYVGLCFVCLSMVIGGDRRKI